MDQYELQATNQIAELNFTHEAKMAKIRKSGRRWRRVGIVAAGFGSVLNLLVGTYNLTTSLWLSFISIAIGLWLAFRVYQTLTKHDEFLDGAKP